MGQGWSQSKTITVKAHDTESGLGQYAVTRTADRPAEWQDSNVFANITENGTYYLWAKDNVQRVSADADADGGEGTPDPGPEKIVIDTIDRSRPVMDDILHSAVDNAPAGMFGYPHFNEVDARSCWPTIWPMTAGRTAASRPSITNLPQMKIRSKQIG